MEVKNDVLVLIAWSSISKNWYTRVLDCNLDPLSVINGAKKNLANPVCCQRSAEIKTFVFLLCLGSLQFACNHKDFEDENCLTRYNTKTYLKCQTTYAQYCSPTISAGLLSGLNYLKMTSLFKCKFAFNLQGSAVHKSVEMWPMAMTFGLQVTLYTKTISRLWKTWKYLQRQDDFAHENHHASQIFTSPVLLLYLNVLILAYKSSLSNLDNPITCENWLQCLKADRADFVT